MTAGESIMSVDECLILSKAITQKGSLIKSQRPKMAESGVFVQTIFISGLNLRAPPPPGERWDQYLTTVQLRLSRSKAPVVIGHGQLSRSLRR